MGVNLAGSRAGHMAMLLFSALVAGSFSLGALAAPFVDPAALMAVRFCISAVFLAVLVAVLGGATRQAARAPWRYLLVGGIFAFYFVMMFEGLKTARPVSAAAVFTLTPAMTALFGWLMMRQVVTGRILAALGLGAIGALWVIFRGDLQALVAFEIGRGEAIYFVGCVAHAVYPPLSRLLNRGEGAIVFAFGITLGGAAALLAWSWRALVETEWAALPPVVWVALAYVSIFASALTVVLLQFAASRLPASKVMAYTYLTPSWVLLWQVALAGEVPAPMILVGVGVTVGALLLLLRDDDAAHAGVRGPAR